MYAIIELGGKQYKIEKDMTVYVDKTEDNKVSIDKVLMYVDGDNVLIGKPYLKNVKVDATVVGEEKGDKVRGMKFKRRKNYARTFGHRHQYLELKIDNMAIV